MTQAFDPDWFLSVSLTLIGITILWGGFLDAFRWAFKGRAMIDASWTGKDFTKPETWDPGVTTKEPNIAGWVEALRGADTAGLLNALHYNLRPDCVGPDGKPYGYQAALLAEISRRLLGAKR